MPFRDHSCGNILYYRMVHQRNPFAALGSPAIIGFSPLRSVALRHHLSMVLPFSTIDFYL